jgi:hypothetical protein
LAANVRIRQEEIETNGSLRRAVFFFYANRSIATRLYRGQSPSRCCALLISNNVSKLFFQPCVFLLEGFDDVLERQHIGRLGAGWQRTRWRDLFLVKVNHHEVIPYPREPRALGVDSSTTEMHGFCTLLHAISGFVLRAYANCRPLPTVAIIKVSDFIEASGGRTRDRTLDLSRVKGTLSR